MWVNLGKLKVNNQLCKILVQEGAKKVGQTHGESHQVNDDDDEVCQSPKKNQILSKKLGKK